jgi:hypothetical protein
MAEPQRPHAVRNVQSEVSRGANSPKVPPTPLFGNPWTRRDWPITTCHSASRDL